MTEIIDVWMQHPTARFINNPIFESLRRWTGGKTVEETPPAELSLGMMDEGKVNRGLISAWYAPHGDMISNEEVKALMDAHPDRFVGIAGVDLRNPVAGVRELRRCVNEWGFKGLRIVQWLWELPPTHPYYYPLFTACVELDIPVCLQVGHTGPLRPSETGRPIPYIDQIALDFPDLKIVCGHIGYPWTEEMIAVARKHPNVYIDTSAYTVKRYPQELLNYLKSDHHKIMFGTNYPMLTHAQCLKDLDSLGLSEVSQERFLSGNAKAIFKL